MAITGRFGTTSGAPYVEARVLLTSTGRFIDVSFLVDTGASVTTLAPGDAARLGVDFEGLSGVQEVAGIGGPAQVYRQEAVILFADDDGSTYAYAVEVALLPPSRAYDRLPSLLGRDVINEGVLTCDRRSGLVEIAMHGPPLE